MNREKIFSYLTIAAAVAVLIAAFFDYNGFDFHVYYAAGQSLLGGRTDLYAADFASNSLLDYRYPPFFLFRFSAALVAAGFCRRQSSGIFSTPEFSLSGVYLIQT